MEAIHAELSGWHLSSCTKHTLQMLCQIEAGGTHSQERTRNYHILLAHLPSMYCTCLRCTALAFDVLLQYIEGCGFHLTGETSYGSGGRRRTLSPTWFEASTCTLFVHVFLHDGRSLGVCEVQPCRKRFFFSFRWLETGGLCFRRAGNENACCI